MSAFQTSSLSSLFLSLQVIWDALVQWLSQSEDPSSPELQVAQDAAMLTFAHILQKDLASFTSSASSLFRLPMLQQNFPSNVVFIYSRFAAGAN